MFNKRGKTCISKKTKYSLYLISGQMISMEKLTSSVLFVKMPRLAWFVDGFSSFFLFLAIDHVIDCPHCCHGILSFHGMPIKILWKNFERDKWAQLSYVNKFWHAQRQVFQTVRSVLKQASGKKAKHPIANYVRVKITNEKKITNVITFPRKIARQI